MPDRLASLLLASDMILMLKIIKAMTVKVTDTAPVRPEMWKDPYLGPHMS